MLLESASLLIKLSHLLIRVIFTLPSLCDKRYPSNLNTNSMKQGAFSLRELEPEDCLEYITLMQRSRKLHAPWVNPPTTSVEFKKLVKRAKDPSFRPLVLCRRSDSAIVGTFNLSQIFYGPLQSAYLGFYVGAPFQGQGAMTEGLKLLIKYAFQELKLHRIEANIQPLNIRSKKLVARCGFKREGYSPKYLKIRGRWRDHERWALLKGE